MSNAACLMSIDFLCLAARGAQQAEGGGRETGALT